MGRMMPPSQQNLPKPDLAPAQMTRQAAGQQPALRAAPRLQRPVGAGQLPGLEKEPLIIERLDRRKLFFRGLV